MFFHVFKVWLPQPQRHQATLLKADPRPKKGTKTTETREPEKPSEGRPSTGVGGHRLTVRPHEGRQNQAPARPAGGPCHTLPMGPATKKKTRKRATPIKVLWRPFVHGSEVSGTFSKGLALGAPGLTNKERQKDKPRD